MEHFKALRPAARVYVTIVVALGTLVLGYSLASLLRHWPGSDWLLISFLTVLTGSFSVKVPSINAYLSVSEAFVFASILLFGPEAGTVTLLLECLVILLWLKPESRPVHRTSFNLAAPALAIWLASTGLYSLSGLEPYQQAYTPLHALLIPLLLFTASYFLLNSWLVALAVGLETSRSPVSIWRHNFAWLSVNYFSGASLAGLIVTYSERFDFSTMAVIVPLLVVCYLTFRTAMGRAEDSYTHLSELNRLYLSTIETLAMAIDAKDQITHGHIRRVQNLAVGLAKYVGISDERLVKAIEAAALLHDMGKLAVPEHILNKPGKLTPAEFEKMKLHAGIGADILSAIEFPYPVVPIVRHHHENWDGTGYPSGLKGTDIPIGARILSVVDCFDALTSDRPYRARLSNREALDILLERRGTMYDPIIVDTFMQVHLELSPERPREDEAHKVAAQQSLSALTRGQAEINASPSAPSLPEVPSQQPIASASTLVPAELAIFYRYDEKIDELVVDSCSSGAPELLKSLRIKLGERMSGWVAANRRPIINSDPALDLYECPKSVTAELRHALSIPVSRSNQLLGVLTFYSRRKFSEGDDRSAQQIASLISAGAFDPRMSRAASSGYSMLVPLRPAATMLCAELVNVDELRLKWGHRETLEYLADARRCFESLLSLTDLLVQPEPHRFVALLSESDELSSRGLSQAFRRSLVELAQGRSQRQDAYVNFDLIVAPTGSGFQWDFLQTTSRVVSRASDSKPVSVH